MRLIQQRLLRGANLYSPQPCILAVIELGDDIPPIREVSAHAARALSAPLQECADYGQLIAHMLLALQQACGQQVDFVHAEPEGSSPLRHRIVVQYALEHLAQAALATALTMAGALARRTPVDVMHALAALRDLAQALELPSSASALRRQALALGIPVQRVSEHAGLLQFGWGHRQWRYLHPGLPDSRLLTGSILRDRHLTRIVLEQANIAVPAGAAVGNLDDALRVAQRLGGTVRVRSLRVDDAHSEERLCRSEDELRMAFEQNRRTGRQVDIEAVEVEPQFTVLLRNGEAQSPSDDVRQNCSRAATVLGLTEGDFTFVRSARRGLLLASIRAGGDPKTGNATEHLLQMRADGDQGRIPVIAVTGTNGKTTTTLMIDHAVRLARLRTGCTTTQGIALDGRLYQRGDCTGYWSHRSVLDSPATEFAVLETARGGLLKRGLAFDRCTVGVLLNVSDDHLGMDGIDTVEALARVKSLVVAAARTAVLNAEDPLCVGARARLAADARVMYFAMDAQHPVLQAHLEAGGDAAWLENETLMLCWNGRLQPVLAAAAIPATMGGLARFNIANSLAATAALAAAGFSAAHIGGALSSFVSDAATNPLRANVFRVGQVTILLDYAHNSAAYAALGTLARGLAQGQVLAVVTSPGDRRDADLRRTGVACAAGFDRLFVYESASRGRANGEAAALIAAGAREAGAVAVEVYPAADVALQEAYRACAAGDVLVFACGTAVETLIEAIRAIDPTAAAAMEVQRRSA